VASAQPTSFRMVRELVRLFSLRLSQTGMARFARVLSFGLALFTVLSIAVMRVEEGPLAPVAPVAIKATRMAMWMVAVLIAFAAAHQRSIADRRDGIEMMAAARGFDGSRLMLVRAAAAFRLSLSWMLLPTLLSAFAALVASGSLSVLGGRALVLVALTVFAVVACALLGLLGAASDWLAPRRGRTVLLATLLLTGLLAEVAKDPALSVTGGLLTVLKGLLYIAGRGELA
jgi:hypothetical protein